MQLSAMSVTICSNRMSSMFSPFLLVIAKEEIPVTILFPVQMDYYTQGKVRDVCWDLIRTLLELLPMTAHFLAPSS